jgi:hypothetical protein
MIAHLSNLLQIDSQIVELQGGVNGPILTAEGVYNKLKRMVEAMDLKSVEQYYTDPKNAEAMGAQEPHADPMSDPAVIKAQIDSQTRIECAKIAADAQIIVAGMQPPPLPVNDSPPNEAETPQEGAQEPQGEQDDLHGPSYALGAIHGAQAASQAPDPSQPGMGQ